ncbi:MULTISPECIES: voltage-gated potassium channel protein [Vibrio]|uniref:voltage-gated potassium channel protein n=1 Tax=Vibrio TaxID=662 RepID=UPI001932E492|nr:MULTISPECIES: voltage-gated potassium channel protein [Vibrio]
MKILKHKLLDICKPSWILAILVAINGYWFIKPVVQHTLEMLPSVLNWSLDWLDLINDIGLAELPRLLLGAGLIIMSIGLALQARLAWAFSLILLLVVAAISFLSSAPGLLLLSYTLVVTLLLLMYWKSFDSSSIAAGSLFALTSTGALMLYAVFGSLYLGDQFSAPIVDMPTAFYFSIVSMSTVGYGDLYPVTSTARLFTASIIVMGITVFATSISAIIGPVIGGNLKKIVKGRISNVMRKNHFIIVGVSPTAHSVYAGLVERGDAVTVVAPVGAEHEYPADADIVFGDPSSADVLVEAGASKAKYILALRNEDAENAFIVLAAKEVGDSDTKTIALVNSSKHIPQIRRVKPDVVFSLQLLGSELLVRTLKGETIDNKLITKLFFGAESTE